MRTGVESFWLRRILEKEEEKEDISKIKQKDQKTDIELCIQNKKMDFGEHGRTWEIEDKVGKI